MNDPVTDLGIVGQTDMNNVPVTSYFLFVYLLVHIQGGTM